VFSANRQATLAKVLIIDDDDALLELVQLHLKAAGHIVRTASDAAQGIRALLSDPPDLIVSDISMPHLDGFELLRALRAEPLTSGIGVIFLTGRNDDESSVKARLLGVDDYLTKPIQVEALLSSIDAVLKRMPTTVAA
jgi:DNA-binding response OmpR family regulator